MNYTCIHINPAGNAELFHAVAQICCPHQNHSPAPVNTYLRNRIVLVQNNKPIGRLSVYFNPHIQGGTWTIGQYECVHDAQAAKVLLCEAEQYICSMGGKKMIGPMDGSTWDNYRFTTTEDVPLFFTEQYHQPWYPRQFEQNGFTVNARYFSGKDQKMLFNRVETLRQQAEFEKSGIRFREINLQCYEEELKKLYPFLLEGFSGNHLYSPIPEDEFTAKYMAVKNYIDPRFVLLAENTGGETAGLFLCLPDYLNRDEKGLVIKTIVRKNSAGLKGLGHVMAQIVYSRAYALGFSYTIHAFIHAQGTSVEISKNYSGVPIKQYTLYEKTIAK